MSGQRSQHINTCQKYVMLSVSFDARIHVTWNMREQTSELTARIHVTWNSKEGMSEPMLEYVSEYISDYMSQEICQIKCSPALWAHPNSTQPFGKTFEQSFQISFAIWGSMIAPSESLDWYWLYLFLCHTSVEKGLILWSTGSHQTFRECCLQMETASVLNFNRVVGQPGCQSIRPVHLVPWFEVSRKHEMFQGEKGDCLLRSKIEHIWMFKVLWARKGISDFRRWRAISTFA